MNKRIIIKPDLCDGCGICELICAVNKTGQWNPALSRIKIVDDKDKKLYSPLICAHCSNPPCTMGCLMNVIKKDETRGWIIRQEDSCIGCHACEIACPFGACFFDFSNEIVVNCDFCGGAPACVEYCPQQALVYASHDEATAVRRYETADRVIY